MASGQIRELSRAFEIGAHTLRHAVLTSISEEQAQDEIAGSKSWVEDVTGLRCLMFCPPRGQYSARDLQIMRRAGYLGLRSVELNSLDFPRKLSSIMLMPTTVQAHPHGLAAFVRNAIRRAALGNLWRFVAHGRSTEWPELARSLLRRAIGRGGAFHLWGHSWELEEPGQWSRLEDVLKFMNEHASQATLGTNGQICKWMLSCSMNETKCEDERIRGEE
jgi:hypothetical protein